MLIIKKKKSCTSRVINVTFREWKDAYRMTKKDGEWKKELLKKTENHGEISKTSGSKGNIGST